MRWIAAAALLGAVAAAVSLMQGRPGEPWSVLAAALALALGLGGWSRRRGPEGTPGHARRPVAWLDRAALALGGVALVAGLFSVLSLVPAPAEAVAARLETLWKSGPATEPAEISGPAPEARSGNWLWDEAGRRELPRRANLQPANRPEVFLQAEGDEGPLLGQRLYVEAFSLGRYADGVWSGAAEPGGRITAGNDGWIRFNNQQGGIAHRIWLGASQSSGQPLVVLQGLQAVNRDELRRRQGLLLLPDAGATNYLAVSRPRTLDQPGAADDAPQIPPGGDFMRRPEGRIAPGLRELALRYAGEGPIEDRLRRLRDRLREHADYSLSFDNPRGLDPLENFLFEERRGHCELFATAGALAARCLGVPSRIAYGWAGGTYYESGKWFVFRARDAHAWAEVWLEGRGWVVMDPTPPQAVGGGRPKLASADELAPVRGTDDEDIAPLPGRHRGESWLGPALAGLLAVLAAVGIARRRREVGAGFVSGSKNGLARYDRLFRQGCARRGVAVEPGVTLKALLTRLDERPDFAADLVRYHYGVRYEESARDSRKERELARQALAWARN
ncbi:transglutaminase-like domain-containing protein [Haloferula sargassicola]|uniref:Transglutaminase-like domain-containing protein n=1 Tax=Haloferula sargassicola TaxID=490096 RepID=A0ABP9UX67_9BACT